MPIFALQTHVSPAWQELCALVIAVIGVERDVPVEKAEQVKDGHGGDDLPVQLVPNSGLFLLSPLRHFDGAVALVRVRRFDFDREVLFDRHVTGVFSVLCREVLGACFARDLAEGRDRDQRGTCSSRPFLNRKKKKPCVGWVVAARFLYWQGYLALPLSCNGWWLILVCPGDPPVIRMEVSVNTIIQGW